MTKPHEYKIRLSFKESKDPFRAYFNNTALVHHGLEPGKPCLLTNLEDGRRFMATAWPAQQKLTDSVVQISRVLQNTHNLKLEDRVTVEKADDEPHPIADSIFVHEHESIGAGAQTLPNHIYAEVLRAREPPLLTPGMIFKVDSTNSSDTFKVAKATPVFPYKAIYRIGPKTDIRVVSEAEANSSANHTALVINSDKIGGLTVQLEKLQECLDAYPEAPLEGDILLRLRLKGGILLHGQPGTGKSTLVNAIAGAGWQRVFHIQKDDMPGLKNIVDTALQLEPSLIVFNPLEKLIAGPLVDVLLDTFKRTDGSRVLLLGVTSNFRDLHERYRRNDLFKYQINIPVPDSKARAEILKIIGGFSKSANSALLDSIAARTHGFVGNDLEGLLSNAHAKAQKRIQQHQSKDVEQQLSEVKITEKKCPEPIGIEDLQSIDWEQALAETRPSAMYDVILETPKTRWSDIGGYHSIKEEIRFTIGLQIRYAEQWASLGLEPTRGILLYGPPGCSKTMIAKAVATEMGFNFLAIKGAEILDKYVGESERKIREIFDTARAASPSIIFFDEIDAIGSTRASSNSGVQGGLHTVTTMLNEMDGIEARRDVFVLAATNMPEVLDPALMRPGRLDRHILVDLPDSEARKEIVQSKLRNSMYQVDSELINWLTEATAGYSGAEVVHVVKEAAAFMFEEHDKRGVELAIRRSCFEHALSRVESRVTETEVEKLRAWGRRSAS